MRVSFSPIRDCAGTRTVCVTPEGAESLTLIRLEGWWQVAPPDTRRTEINLGNARWPSIIAAKAEIRRRFADGTALR